MGEARALESALAACDERGLHQFRIACKRLRYAFERMGCGRTGSAGAETFAQLSDALGEAHDRDVLLAILPPTMGRTQRRLLSERASYVDRARELWMEVPDSIGAACSHRFHSAL
jgi:CHAD domain-containing protein